MGLDLEGLSLLAAPLPQQTQDLPRLLVVHIGNILQYVD